MSTPPPLDERFEMKLTTSFSPTIPMAASAAPAPPSKNTGRIRLVDPINPSVNRYLSNTLHNSDGSIIVSQTLSDALIAEYDSYGSSRRLSVKVRTQRLDFFYLELTAQLRISPTGLIYWGLNGFSHPSLKSYQEELSRSGFLEPCFRTDASPVDMPDWLAYQDHLR